MKTRREYKMTEAVFKAKLLLESRHLEEKDLKWAYASTLDALNAEANPTKLYVLEGEVPYGYIIASYALKTVKVFDENLSLLITYNVREPFT